MRGVILATGVFIASAGPAFAQAGKVTVGFNVGVSIPVSPEELRDVADQDVAVAGHVTVGLARALAVRGEIGQSQFKPNTEFAALCDAFSIDCDQKINHLSIGLQWGGFGTRGALGLSRARVLPYGFIAFSSYELEGDIVEAEDARQTGFNAGFGINIKIAEYAGIQGDVHLHGVRPNQNGSDEDTEWLYWATPSVGVWVGF